MPPAARADTGIGPNMEKGLAPLRAFPELRHLEIDVASGVDLAPLAELNLETLALRYLRDADLTPLGEMRSLESLILWDLRDVRVPSTLALAPSLSLLVVANAASLPARLGDGHAALSV